jgi:hypothetical protein
VPARLRPCLHVLILALHPSRSLRPIKNRQLPHSKFMAGSAIAHPADLVVRLYRLAGDLGQVMEDRSVTYSASQNSCYDRWVIDYLHSATAKLRHCMDFSGAWKHWRSHEWNNPQRLLAILNSEALKCRA